MHAAPTLPCSFYPLSNPPQPQEEEGSERGKAHGGQLQQPMSPGGTSRYPTLAADAPHAAPRADDADLQVGAADLVHG